MRCIVRVLIVLFLASCATLPEIHPWADGRHARATPTIVGARGELKPAQAKALLDRLQAQGKGSDLLARHVAIEEQLAGTPLTAGNDVTLLYDGPSTYRAMFEAMQNAHDHINAEFYIIEDDAEGRRFSDLLIAKREQGVAVNLIYDSVGSLNTPVEYFERLRAAGVQVLQFNPVNPLQAREGWRINNRDHRKIVIVDGRIAFTGGINISNVYSSGSGPRRGSSGSSPFGGSEGKHPTPTDPGWRDTNVRIAGPAVSVLQKLFIGTWQRQGGPQLADRNWFPAMKPQGDQLVRIIDSGPDDELPAIYATYIAAIRYAEKSVHLTMAYFVPDPQTLEALTQAAARGVDVTLVLPSYTDFWAVFHAGRSHYKDLLEAGVKIYERQDALLHAKTAVVDGVWSTVGSSNLDWRSFLHNTEVNAIVLGPKFGDQMEAMFKRDLAASARITREAWQQRPLSVRMKEWAARIWAYWL
jgi:cardiolipin synthase A/B